MDSIIVWIRNELRVQDNLALWSAVKDARSVVPLYILDEEFPSSVSSKKTLILGSLAALRDDLRSLGGDLFVRRGNPREVLLRLIRETGSAGVYVTTQYDPDNRHADAGLVADLRDSGKLFRSFKDQVLFEGEEILNGAGEPYRVYSAYRRAWLERSVDIAPPLPSLKRIQVPELPAGEIPPADEHGGLPGGELLPVGSERSAVVTLNNFLGNRVAGYHRSRDLLAMDGTSRISHHLSAGSLGVRTLYHALKGRTAKPGKERSGPDVFLNQIIWREFYKQILCNFPHVAGGSFRREFDAVSWKTGRGEFEAWTSGLTGYPVVDAAMRQLSGEGWMHNRGRMITASFLTKDLHIDWRMGEEHFMRLLADGDMALNNGGWQWSAGTGTDAQPWFRVFNPATQGKKFDPEGEYVKRYVPELRAVPAKYIHEPWKMPAQVQREAGCRIGNDYPGPVVDHGLERNEALRLYGKVTRRAGAGSRNPGSA